MPPIAQVYPLAFKQGMMLAAKCEGFAHGIAVSMPGCNTTQARRRPRPHTKTRAAPNCKSYGGLCLSGCLERHSGCAVCCCMSLRSGVTTGSNLTG